MFNDDEIELSAEERAAFAALPRERAPGDLLEERIVRQLRSEGLISHSSEPRRQNRLARFALRAAAAVVLFAAGALTERFLASRSDDTQVTPIPARAAEQKTVPAQRAEPTKLAQLEVWL